MTLQYLILDTVSNYDEPVELRVFEKRLERLRY